MNGCEKSTRTMGQTIRRLRMEQNLTQETLAELLGVTSQAVSKWENNIGLPDISQIVPLAGVFGVPTDVLFGLDSTTAETEVQTILRDAQRKKIYGNVDSYLAAYDHISAGLRRYPGNHMLLMESITLGEGLSLPENGWLYAGERAKDISADTIRRARLVIAYTENTNDVFRARQILIHQLVFAGRHTEAMEKANKYPERVDFTANSHKAQILAAAGDIQDAIVCVSTELDYSLQAFENNAVTLAKACYAAGAYADAAVVYERYLAAMDVLFDGNPAPYHDFDSGDCYILLAQSYLAMGERDRAMDCVEKAINSCIARMEPDREHISPFLRHSASGWAYAPLSPETVRVKCAEKLASPEIAPLTGDARFAALQKRIENL